MEDIGGLIGAGVAALTVIGSGVAWLLKRRDSRKDPIPKESAAVALAQSSVSIMQGVADELRSGLASEKQERAAQKAEHKAEMAELHEEIAALKAEADETRADVKWLRSTLGVAASYIENLLRWARSESRPPIPPLPEQLRSLVDPSLHNLTEEG